MMGLEFLGWGVVGGRGGIEPGFGVEEFGV